MKTTKTDFAYFKKRVEYWVNKFGLFDYQFYIRHESIEGEEFAACVLTDHEARTVNVFLEPDWGENKVTRKDLERCAIHEVVHVLLDDFEKAIEKNRGQKVAEHAVVRRLEKLLLEKLF